MSSANDLLGAQLLYKPILDEIGTLLVDGTIVRFAVASISRKALGEDGGIIAICQSVALEFTRDRSGRAPQGLGDDFLTMTLLLHHLDGMSFFVS